EGHDHDHVLDPHVWLDPVLAQKEVEAIEAGLVKADPANKADYEKNADAYIAKLKELDTEFKTGLKDVKRKDFITQHAAFSYLAKQY
ncbi:zinc ABC transporter substrate-binding protein, partial [Paenibacillus sp. EKM208P]